jgi:hypothetical protein
MIKSAPPLARFFVAVPVMVSLRMLFHAGDGKVRRGAIEMWLGRPLHFHALPRPALRNVLSEAFSGLFTGSKG